MISLDHTNSMALGEYRQARQEADMSETKRLQNRIDEFLDRKTAQYPDITRYIDHVGELERVQ